MSKEKIEFFCNKSIEILLYILIYSLPFSRALVENAAITAIVVWGFKKIFVDRGKNFFTSTPLNWPILIFITICILSGIFGTNISLSFRTLIRKTIEYILLFFIVVDTVKNERILKRLIFVALIIIGLVAIDGIFQYFRGWDFFRGRSMIIKGRISGPFIYPGDLGGYLVTVIPIVLGFCFLKLKEKRRLLAITLLVLSSVLLICLVLNATKSAWLAFLLSMVIGAIFTKRKYMMLIPVIILLVMYIFIPEQTFIKSRMINFLNFSEGGGKDRQLLWRDSMEMFLEKPILGQGLGTYMYNFNRFKSKEFAADYKISYPHNCFLQMAAEIGVFGLLAFIWIVSSILVYAAYLLLKHKEENFIYIILWGLSVGLVAYLIHSFFDTNLYSLPLAVLFWVVLGLIVSAMKIIETQPAS